MEIKMTHHAHKRLKEYRQRGISYSDVKRVAKEFKPKVDSVTGFKIMGTAKSGKIFEIPIADYGEERVIISVIGLRK